MNIADRIRTPLRAVLLAAAAVSCSDTSTESPATGQLAISSSGLPAGVSPAIVVSGPASYRQLLTAPTTLSALPAGSYTVTASAVASPTERYGPSPTTQTVTVRNDALSTANEILYGVVSASLEIQLVGLPSGAVGSVSISGPGGFSRAVSTNSRLDLLEPGTYSIAAANVTVGTTVFRAPRQTVALSASRTPVRAIVDYGAGDAALRVNISGLPFDVPAAVDITGPGGFARRVSTSGSFGRLESGSYTVVASVVGGALTTHPPTVARQTVVLSGTDTSTVTVTYGSVPLELALRPFAEGLTQPVFLTAPTGDRRQFIVERVGRIRLVLDGVVQSTPFLDITTRVNNVGERGLLSMTFDPAYATNGFLYVFYVALNGDVVVERIASTPGANVAAGPTSLVIRIPHGGSEHHGGMIAFGPDSMFYLAPGDGACCGDPRNAAQNLGTLLGKVLRVDVRTLPYTIPADNPFRAQAGALPEIWALGLRNPWRFAFDAPTTTLYIGDVGQDAREEVNAVSSRAGGLNYGWPFTEGNACFRPSANCTVGRDLTAPVLDYSHADGCSVTGGFVYRGTEIPELAGRYLYADFCRGWVRSFLLVNGRSTEQRTWAGVSLPFVNSFGQDGNGELYVISGARVLKIVRRTP